MTTTTSRASAIHETTIAGLRFGVPSPSLLCLVGFPVQLAFIPGHKWRVIVRDNVTAHGYDSREAAASALARAMGTTQEQTP